MIPLTVLVIAAAFQATPQAQDSGRVSGRWQLDAQESDNPRTLMAGNDSTGGGGAQQPREDGYRGRRGGGGGGGGEFGGFGGRGEGGMEGRRGEGADGDRSLSSGDRAARQGLMQLVFRPPQDLELLETDTSFTLIAADTVRLLTNGRKLERRADDHVKVEYRARRRDGRLEVERQVGNAGKLTETYFISPRGGQLFVVVHFQPANGRGELTFRRIYEPAGH